jgi:dynactin complex subunit
LHITQEVRGLREITLNKLRKNLRKKYMKLWYKNTVPVSRNEGLASVLQSVRKNTSYPAYTNHNEKHMELRPTIRH